MNRFKEQFNQESIISKARSLRPFIKKQDDLCPFCPQNEELIDRIILEQWYNEELCARIVSNKYPITNKYGANGFHDVIIDTLIHNEKPKDFSNAHWNILLSTIQKRWIQLSQNSDISFIQVFKNYGEDAGASIEHSHWQILALEKIPFKIKRAAEYMNNKWRSDCYLCGYLNKEGYVVYENDKWYAWVPPVPEYNGEVWLVPKRHITNFSQLEKIEIELMGILIKGILLSYDKMSPETAYNICFMDSDLKSECQHHFYAKIVMRSGKIAGFEIATGSHIITKTPQEYSDELKYNLKGMYK